MDAQEAAPQAGRCGPAAEDELEEHVDRVEAMQTALERAEETDPERPPVEGGGAN